MSAGTIAHDISVDGRPKPVRAYSSFGGDPEFSSNVAVVYGEVEHGSLVRIHSRCTYSEVFASHECDCGWQLQRSRHLLTVRGGVLIYLDQEGRGAGLRAKADAYRMHQEDGLDTFQAYEKLGLPADSRDYADAAKLLKEELRLHWVKLLTNNPDKIAALENMGIKVERVPSRGEAYAGNHCLPGSKEAPRTSSITPFLQCLGMRTWGAEVRNREALAESVVCL